MNFDAGDVKCSIKSHEFTGPTSRHPLTLPANSVHGIMREAPEGTRRVACPRCIYMPFATEVHSSAESFEKIISAEYQRRTSGMRSVSRLNIAKLTKDTNPPKSAAFARFEAM